MALRASPVVNAVLHPRVFDHAMQQREPRQGDRIIFLSCQCQSGVGALLRARIIAVIKVQVTADEVNAADTVVALIVSVNGFGFFQMSEGLRPQLSAAGAWREGIPLDFLPPPRGLSLPSGLGVNFPSELQ